MVGVITAGAGIVGAIGVFTTLISMLLGDKKKDKDDTPPPTKKPKK
jgi:hypothetical protein